MFFFEVIAAFLSPLYLTVLMDALVVFGMVTFMPRYFYHLSDGVHIFSDNDGVELENLAAARRHLVSHVRELRGTLSDKGILDWTKWTVIVSDYNNKPLQKMGFNLIPRI